MSGRVILQHRIFRADLKANPIVLYVFGDNERRVGLGGQAYEMRGEPNAVGVATLAAPGRRARRVPTPPRSGNAQGGEVNPTLPPEPPQAPFRPFTGPCRDWSDQARNLSDEDLEAALAAREMEKMP